MLVLVVKIIHIPNENYYITINYYHYFMISMDPLGAIKNPEPGKYSRSIFVKQVLYGT